MADISQDLQKILDAIYGEEVRGSIYHAISLINDVSEVVLTTGTAVTSASSSSTGFFTDSLYLNTDTYELWKCVGTDMWQSLGILKGATGNGIDNIIKTSTSGLVDIYTITYTDGTTDTFNVTNGENGTDGNDGISVTGVSLLSKVGLLATYRMTFSDGTHFDYTVSDGASGSGTGDMTKAVYDTDNDGIVDAAETLQGLLSSITELNHLQGVTSAVQTQLNGKANASDIPTVDQTYSAISSNAQSGTAVADALTNYYDKSEIDAQEKNLVSYGGAVTFANLPALSAANVNKFWLVTDSFTTTSDFVVGAGVTMPADSHIAIINTGTDASPIYKYDDFGGFIDTSTLQSKTIPSMTVKGAAVATVENALTAINNGLDDWTATAQVQSDNTVTFTGLDNSYGYDLYCQNKLIGISAMTKTGSGTSVTLKYTVTGAATGDVCKLRILK